MMIIHYKIRGKMFLIIMRFFGFIFGLAHLVRINVEAPPEASISDIHIFYDLSFVSASRDGDLR
jgi:hypothetical protein